MRITNSMMTNSSLLSINRNKRTLSKYEEQMNTGKKIQTPSDDPIIAARSLKFQSSLTEIGQYKTNVKDAQSWIEVTEQAVDNTRDIIKRVYELCVKGSTETLTKSDRKDIATEIEELKEQMMAEGNVSYAGRYVFSGYQTNKSLTYDYDKTESFQITESFSAEDVETVKKVYDNDIHEAYRIRLGYSDTVESTPAGVIPGFNVVTLDSTSTSPQAYNPPSTGGSGTPTAYYLKDTGELVFNSDDLASIPASFDFTYQKDQFKKGDIRPDHYFNCTNLATGDTYAPDEEAMTYQVSYSQEIQVNTMGNQMLTIDMVRDVEELLNSVKEIKDDESADDELKKDLLGGIFESMIDKTEEYISENLSLSAELGGTVKRLELTESRLGEDNINFTGLLSENEDVDMAETLVNFSSQETIYQAALAATSKVIQNTLLDYL